MGERWARFVTRFRVPVLLVALAGLLTVAVPTTHLRLGLPDDGTATAGTTQRKANDLIRDGFGPGFNGPLTVVVSTGGSAEGAAAQVATTIQGLPDVDAVAGPMLSADGATALLTVIPATAPTDQATTDQATTDLVTAIRDRKATLHQATGADIAVTGQTAVNIDTSDKIGAALLPYLGLVVGLAFLLLMLVFRSVLVPLKATLGFLLSIGATFGAVVAVFQWGWLGSVLGVAETGPIMSLLPVLLVGILFGLAMDYQVFLVTRMREDHVHGAGAQPAVITGFRHGARVVTAAAIIMISVFSGFILSPEVLIKSIGFALAFGVLVDAFVVRMTIVPAAMSLLDRAAWWLPRWLDRALPKVDVEGEGLAAPADAVPPVPAPTQHEPRHAEPALRACGICGTDVSFLHMGGMPLGPGGQMTVVPLGHEPAGEVAEVGADVTGLKVGDRVVINPQAAPSGIIGCGGALGGMREYLLIEDAVVGKNLAVIPDTVPFDVAALNEPMAVALHCVNRSEARTTDKVVVFGAGPIGLGATIWLKLRGVKHVAVADVIPERLERATAVGADAVIDSSHEDVTARLTQLHGQGANALGQPRPDTDIYIYIDAAGAAAVLNTALASAKWGAKLVMVAVQKKSEPIDIAAMLRSEMTFTASMGYRTEIFEVTPQLAQHWERFAQLISHRIPFSDVERAFQLALTPGTAEKVIVTFDDQQ